MSKNGFARAVCLCFAATHLFALTVELVDEYQHHPSPILAKASEAPVSSPELPRGFVETPNGQIAPAVYPAHPPVRQIGPSEKIQGIDTNYQVAR